MPQTIVEKIAQAHLAEGPKRPLRAGDFISIRPAHVMTHDNTAAVIKKFKAIGSKKIFDPHQPVFTLDHDIQNQDEANQRKYREIEAFAREHGIDFYPAGTGIGHQIMVERGYVTPGSFVVASDSHSNMYGALGAVGTPVVRTDAAAIWATGEFWWQIPRTVQVVLEGEMPKGTTGKDIIIALCGLYNDEVLNAAVEFTGSGVETLSMDAQLTVANMSTEWGALVAWFPFDTVTFRYLEARRCELEVRGEYRLNASSIRLLLAHPPAADPEATYAGRIVLDLSQVTPHVSGPDTVQVMSPLAALEKQRVKIDKAYLLSCVNSRLEDLETAARAIRGKKVAPGVKFYLGAASKWVQEQAERTGAWQALVDAGAQALPAGCGPCIGLGVGLLEAGEVGISATNRNFKGRMGSRDARCYLGSPEVVAASAVAGYICGPGASADVKVLERSFTAFSQPVAPDEPVEIMSGFPSGVRGRLVFLPKDNLNTDAIYAGQHTYREDMTPEMMAQVIFDNYDAEGAKRLRSGDILVGGTNFGSGSSREQAVTALKAKGIPLVIAGSFSQTYLRNAFNNGFLCIEVPRLVAKLREQLAAEIKAGQRTIITGDGMDIDFSSGTLTCRGERFHFPALGTVPQSLVIAGGVEKLVARKLGLAAQRSTV